MPIGICGEVVQSLVAFSRKKKASCDERLIDFWRINAAGSHSMWRG